LGRADVQAVGRRRFATEPRLRSKTRSCGINGEPRW